jgi:ABC-type Mn2+/Zn2+ transport system permease subunit
MTIEGLLLSAAMAVAAGLIGCFAVMRRMALAADALSHVALPGIGIAIALHIHPLVGAGAMLLFGALMVWGLEEVTRVPTELVIGVVFSAALAVGSMITSGEDLIDALLGHPTDLGWPEIAFGVLAAAGVIGFVVSHKHKLVVALVSPDIARTAGVNVRRLNLIYLQMFALTIALGLRYLGVLLMGSLLIVPAAAAMRLSRNLTEMLVLAAAFAVTAVVAGSVAAEWLHRETGPVIVSVAAAGFLLSLWRRQ